MYQWRPPKHIQGSHHTERSQDGRMCIIRETQVKNWGQIISEDMRKYIYIPELLNNNIRPAEVQMPFQEEDLNGMLASLKSTIHHNSVGAVIAVGKKCSLQITMSQASDQRVAKGLILYQTKLYLLSGNIKINIQFFFTVVKRNKKIYPVRYILVGKRNTE